MKLKEMKNAGLANYEIRKQLEETTKNLTSNREKLNRFINDAAHQRKRRKEMEDLKPDLSKKSHKNNKLLKEFTHNRPRRPPMEDSYPNLHKTIIAIATAGAGSDSRRRTENLNASPRLFNEGWL